MLSFHNDPKIKEKYINRVINHREMIEMDSIINGNGIRWKKGERYAVRCTFERYDHSLYPVELGIPELLAKLEDIIFNNLPNKEAILWPKKFLESIPIGVNLDKVLNIISINRMNNLLEIQNKFLEFYRNHELKEVFINVISSIELIKKCHESELNKSYCDFSSAELEAELAAESAARSSKDLEPWLSAWIAVWSAAWSAKSAAMSAMPEISVKLAASSAEYAAEWSVQLEKRSVLRSAARSVLRLAAWKAAWKKEADFLLKTLSECK